MAILYTIGTWRVSRDAYLSQFKSLGIQKLVDVRGNPAAGRQQELKRSNDFKRALASCGVEYEYWGNELGEDALEGEPGKDLKKVLGQLATQTKHGTVCLLGHLHEPQGCHRLRLCELLLAHETLDLKVVHLLWEDHQNVKQLQHVETVTQAAEVLRFFEEAKILAETVRQDRKVPDPTTNLETIPWDKFSASHFQDGRPHHFLLPFSTDIFWYPHWLSEKEADDLQHTVQERVTFLHPTYMFQDQNGGFAKTLIKRGQVRICGDDCPGAVASQPLESWSSTLLRQVENAAGCAFNCFVANHYANGQVVINWHSDSGPGDDEGLGPNPHIGSLSLGEKRVFSLKSKRPVGGRMIHLDIPLTHGSLLIMGKNSQTHWLHALLHDDSCLSERINLTFRFYARQSTKHIEGMEHNHEWEAAPGSTRVLLHRTGFGRPVLVDLPDDLEARQLSRYLSTVLPGFRGFAKVTTKNSDASWRELAPETVVIAEACRFMKTGQTPEVSVSCKGQGKGQSQNRVAVDPASSWDANSKKGGKWGHRPTGGSSKGSKGYGRGSRA